MAHIWGKYGVNLYHMVLGQFYLFGHSIYGNLFGLFESFFSVEFELLNINIKVEVDFLSSNILATVSINFFFKFNPLKWRLGEKNGLVVGTRMSLLTERATRQAFLLNINSQTGLARFPRF